MLLIFAGSWLRAAEWFEPWAGVHRAWGGAVYANMARNLIRYDVADTKLEVVGPVATQWMSIAQCFAGGPVDPPAPGTRGAR